VCSARGAPRSTNGAPCRAPPNNHREGVARVAQDRRAARPFRATRWRLVGQGGGANDNQGEPGTTARRAPMSSIVKLAEDRWQARYRTPDGASRKRTFTRKADAQQFLTGVDHRKLSGEYVDQAAGRVTFGVYARRWADAQPHRPSTSASLESMLRVHIIRSWERDRSPRFSRARFRRSSPAWSWRRRPSPRSTERSPRSSRPQCSIGSSRQRLARVRSSCLGSRAARLRR
jgi:hypothetical protein